MQALFLDLGDPAGPNGSARFAMLYRPSGPPRGLVVYAPPFAEEMNKARRMVALQARALARDGHAVLIPDLLGCGDSAGDFGDASWQAWIDELVSACRWLRRSIGDELPGGPAESTPLTLWGLRGGALLAAAAAASLGDVPTLLLWQPATSGQPLLKQFLRLHTVGALTGGGARNSTDALKALLAAGQTVEVAGYRLSPALAQGLEQARLSPAAGVRQLHWLELSSREDASMSPASTNHLSAWRQAGTMVHTSLLHGPAFWQTVEIEDAPALVQATLAAFAA